LTIKSFPISNVSVAQSGELQTLNLKLGDLLASGCSIKKFNDMMSELKHS